MQVQVQVQVREKGVTRGSGGSWRVALEEVSQMSGQLEVRLRARTRGRARARVWWRARAVNRWQSRMPLGEEEN